MESKHKVQNSREGKAKDAKAKRQRARQNVRHKKRQEEGNGKARLGQRQSTPRVGQSK
jgi:hypothetical protein